MSDTPVQINLSYKKEVSSFRISPFYKDLVESILVSEGEIYSRC